MPADSSVFDVAFELHSEIGTHCIAGKVNHKLVPLSHRLQSGDQVEVLTSQSQTPKGGGFPSGHSQGAHTAQSGPAQGAAACDRQRQGDFRPIFQEREVEATNEIVTRCSPTIICPRARLCT